MEGRLTAVKTEATGQPTREASFSYDANGNRVLAVYKTNGVETSRTYTPFPDYDEEQPVGDTATRRVTFSANGQAVVQRRQKGDTVERFSLHTDHLGNVAAVANSAGVYVANSYAVYEPFGAFSVQPTATNPSVSDRGFTGHRQNNTGSYNLGLIYMNARYYHPQLGRFVSPDTIVPDPANPQSHNRYAYTRNSPVKLIDPTGHKECGADSGCKDTLPHSTPFQEYLYVAWLYYKTFDKPFEGERDTSQEFIAGGHNGTDWPGTFNVFAPSDGTVVKASNSTAAGMWQIQNKKTGEIREWSNNPDSPGFQGKLTTHDRDADGLYPPERLLAPDEWGNVEWVDIAPDWSHTTGTEIRIQHSYGLQTVYYHTTPSIGENLQVNQGDLLGVTANTGYSTGVHLHYTLEFSYGKTTIALNPLVPPAQIAHLFP